MSNQKRKRKTFSINIHYVHKKLHRQKGLQSSVLIISLELRRLLLLEKHWDLFVYPSNPEDMRVLWDASISGGLALQIVTE